MPEWKSDADLCALCTRELYTPVIKSFATRMPQRFEVVRNNVILHGTVVSVDDASGKSVSIQRLACPLNFIL